MTREEAKGNLIHAIRWNDMPKKEALEMALNHWSEEPKTGHWREVDINEYACSNCSHCFSIVSEDNSIEEYKYCPNCGCKMESEG